MAHGESSPRSSPTGFAWLNLLADVAFTACLVMIAIKQQFAFGIPHDLALGSLRVDGQDLVAVAMVALALLGRFWKHVAGLRRVVIGVLLVIVVVSTARWMQVDGLQSGFNHERPWIYAFAALIFGLAFARRRWRTWRVILVVVGLLIAITQLIALFALGWAQGFADSTLVHGDFYGTRPLGAEAALVMVLALLIALTITLWPVWLRALIAIFLGLSCIWSQDRSVWLSLVVALLVYLVIAVKNRAASWGTLISVGLLGVLALVSITPAISDFSILPVNTNAIRSVDAQNAGLDGDDSVPNASVYGDVTIDAVRDDASGSPAFSTGTLTWRVEMWKSRIVAERSVTSWAFGETFGPNSLSAPGTTVVRPNISSHSEPVEDLVRGGIIGLLCIFGLFVSILVRKRESPLDAWIFAWALIPYGVLYVWPTWAWVILGLCLSTRTRAGAKEAESLSN